MKHKQLSLRLILLLIPYQFIFSQLSNIHYLQPLVFSKYDDTTIIQEFIYLSTPSETNITVNVTMPDEITIPRLSVYSINSQTNTNIANGTITLSNTTPVRVSLINNMNNALATGDSPITLSSDIAGTIISANTGGLVFKSSDLFFVNYRGRSTPQAGSVLTKGTAALGKTFFWGGTPTTFTTTIEDVGNMASIMATEDDTTITITNIKPGTELLNGKNNPPIISTTLSRTLQKGQSFILYAKVKTGTLSIQDTGWLGAKITSNKNIAVTVGGLMQLGSVASGTATNNRDIAVDQLIPVEQLGNEHIIMQGNGGDAETVTVIATENNTSITLNANTTSSYTLNNAGDYVNVPASFFVNKNMYIKTNKAVYVFHKIFGGTGLNTNSFMFIPPLSCFGQNTVNMIPDAKRIGLTVYGNTELAVLATAGASAPLVTINGSTTIPPISNSGNIAVPGNPNWKTYRYGINTPEIANHNRRHIRISSTGTIQAELLGATGDAGFGNYYSGFGTAPIVNINVANSPTSRPCTGNTGNPTSSLSVSASFGSYQWYKNGIPIAGATTNSYNIPTTDTSPAEYNVILTNLGGCQINSNVVKSYPCPCYKTGATGSPEITTIGISTRESNSTPNWPTDINNGFVALESNNKGLVITRNEDPEINIKEPVDGMLVFDTIENCLKIYNGTKWNCINQTCN